MEKKQASELDLVFICDCTASMGSYIQSAKENITSIIEQIQASEQRDVQFALISYRDHPPQDNSYVTQVFDFTPSVRKAKEYVQTMEAQGGGDTPEAVAAALRAALNLPYRKSATKIAVIVADAPPHGLSDHGNDGFPNGSPDGADPIVDSRLFAEREIVLYAIGCEPQLGQTPFARDFFKAIAQVTGGRYISLGNAKVLPKVIIGGAEEEIELNKIAEEVETEAALVQAEAEEKKECLSEESLYTRVTERLQSRGVQTAQLKVDDIGDSKDSTDISRKIAECDNMAAVRAMLNKLVSPSPSYGGHSGRYRRAGDAELDCKIDLDCSESNDCELPSAYLESSSSSAPKISMECQSARVEKASISCNQVSRMMTKKKYSAPKSK